MRWLRALLPPLLAIVAALLIGALVMAVAPPLSRLRAGEPLDPINPLQVYQVMLHGALGTRDGISGVLYHASVLTFTGLAVALPFQAGRFNIGGEGQLRVAGLAATVVALGLAGPLAALPELVQPVVYGLACIAAAAAAGALWGAIPGALAAYRGAHEVITTIMLNFVAVALTQYLVVSYLIDPHSGVVRTRAVPEAARWASLSDWGLPTSPHVDVSAALFLALAASVAVWLALGRLNWGFELRAVGASPDAAEAAGISGARVAVGSMAAAGALAGLACLALIHGHKHHFGDEVFIAGYGFLGIAVALLARNHPLGVVPAALLFGVLFQGTAAVEVYTEVPKALVQILQGVVILAVVVTGELARRGGWGRR